MTRSAANCSWTVGGALQARYGIELTTTLKAGIEYKDGALAPVASVPTWTTTAVGPEVSARGSMKLRCALVPKVSLRAYESIGPYFKSEAFNEWDVTYSEKCESGDSKPRAQVAPSMKVGIDARIGADFIIFGAPVLHLEQSIGELTKTFKCRPRI